MLGSSCLPCAPPHSSQSPDHVSPLLKTLKRAPLSLRIEPKSLKGPRALTSVPSPTSPPPSDCHLLGCSQAGLKHVRPPHAGCLCTVLLTLCCPPQSAVPLTPSSPHSDVTPSRKVTPSARRPHPIRCIPSHPLTSYSSKFLLFILQCFPSPQPH